MAESGDRAATVPHLGSDRKLTDAAAEPCCGSDDHEVHGDSLEVTKIVDSLHRRGFVHRTRDERDRRSVRVLAAPGYWKATRPATARLADQIYALNTNFTPAELAAITRWVGGVTEALRAQTEALRDGTD